MRRFAILVVLFMVSGCAQAGQAAAPGADSTLGVLNPKLLQIDQVPGSILDVSATRILFKDPLIASTLRVKDRATGAMTTLPPLSGIQPGAGRLTSRGVVLVATKAGGREQRLYEWPGAGGLTDLGPFDPTEPLLTRGPYLVWNDGTSLFRREVETASTSMVEPNAWTTGFGVLANGDVVYTSAEGQLERYHDGIRTPLTRDSATRSFGPVTDGTTVTFTVANNCCEVQRTALWRYDATGSSPLTKPSGQGPDVNGYEVAGGWTVFSGPATGGRRQVWRRGPDGTVTQLSDVGGRQAAADPRVLAVNSAGATVYAIADTVYLDTVGQPSVVLASGFAGWASHRRSRAENFAVYADGKLQVAVQGRLFVWTD